MTTDIVPTTQTGIIHSMDDAMKAAQAMAASGFFQDARQAAQAVVKILAGQELGVGPFTSMTGVYIIQGRPALSANIMAAAVKRSGRYNFRVIELTDTRCEIAFFENGQECGRSTFTADEARKAGTKNMDKYPRNMLYARAISNGVRWFCPDVLGGSPVYTPEELGASVNEDGQVIDVTVGEPEPMTLGKALKLENSRGMEYGDMDNETLCKIASQPSTPADRRQAAKLILAYRGENNEVELDPTDEGNQP